MPDSNPPVRTVHVIITGRVQGVWFRGWTVETARGLGLDGWVRNRRDGSVEAVFSGEPDRVAAMLAACEQGPPAAKVNSVEVSEVRAPPEASGFEVRPTE
ncbi:MAG: acylphosphatase [Hyphomicrobiales bacterium]